MSCQATKCANCTNVVKACSLINGLCVSCYSLQEQKKKEALNPPTPPPQPNQ